MSKAKKPKSKNVATKRLNLPNDEPVKINMPFDDAIKKALTTKIKDKKIK